MAAKNPISISKTATDSLYAKLSAIDAGWLHSNVDEASSHPLHVYANLLQLLHRGPKRRQSPLVNAGYAARMAVMGYTMERWVDGVVNEMFRQKAEGTEQLDNIRPINVVIIGCGMDALGIWSKHLLRNSLNKIVDTRNENTSLRLQVYEFDCWDNCVLKKESLLESGLVTNNAEVDADNFETVLDERQHIHVQGSINLDLDMGASEPLGINPDYTLASLDLREVLNETSILSQAGARAGLDTSQPTIVLSELVLTYLGYEGADAVMKSTSEILNGNRSSMFACLEPMFPTEDDPSNAFDRIISVQESYARDYSLQFLGRLQSGGDTAGSSTWLHPLGFNLQTLQSRLISCGLTNSSCNTLKECARHVAHIIRGKSSAGISSPDKAIGPKFLCAKEPFDEHTALALNLGCYAVVHSFHPSLKQDCSSFIESICPWNSSIPNKDSKILIKPISTAAEDAQVNSVYGRLYLHFYNDYPAIRKMVKSALKGDLSSKNNSLDSSIRSRFIDEDGDFWVAVISNTGKEPYSRVVGCIGIKRRSNATAEYEIYRLAVDDSYRGYGIGKKLIETAEMASRLNRATELYAVTPSCLIAANQLYESHGYSLRESKCFMAGSLRMNVYSKTMRRASSS